ncbi:MAG: hypothetical protein ACKVOW_11420 [Chitinophagaceae bacterium]
MKIEFPPFPNSKVDPFLVTSPQTAHYNCIAWAYGDNSKWFWPDISNIYYWPLEIPREEKVEYFVLLFKSIGYEVCNNGDLEEHYQKIAIYTDKFGKPTHAARQLENGFWTSKLGQHFDVTHTIFSMQDGSYGNVALFMQRQK